MENDITVLQFRKIVVKLTLFITPVIMLFTWFIGKEYTILQWLALLLIYLMFGCMIIAVLVLHVISEYEKALKENIEKSESPRHDKNIGRGSAKPRVHYKDLEGNIVDLDGHILYTIEELESEEEGV